MKRATFTDGDGNPPPEQHLESLILDSISDAVMSIDGQWRFTYINSQAEALLGLPKERLLGSLVWGDYADSIGVELRPHCERAARTRTQVSFCSFYQPLHIWLAIHVYPHAQGVAVLMQDITHLKKQESQLQDLAQRDGLTNLPNRRMCQRTLETALAGIPSKRQNVSVLFVDIDLFKLVNDSYGHDAGDMVLVELARRFDALAGADAFVSRISGDEFVFLLEGKSDVELGCFAELLLLTVARPITIREADVVVEASVGVARCPTAGNTASDLLRNAESAMYAAKGAGRNAWWVYSEEFAARQRHRQDLARQIRHALQRDQFELHYQPQISLVTHEIVGAEALVRWMHPERGLIMPDAFIPIAEETALIVALGNAVIKKTCQQISAWTQAGFPAFPVSANLSARHLCSEGLAKFVAQMLDDHRVNPSSLRLEITETTLTSDLETASKVLLELQAMGIHVALDDFGTGYSNLAFIQRFPIHTLKIDKSFIGSIETDDNARLLTQTIISLGKSLKLDVLAEGVETEWQARYLRASGCDRVQGFYFSRPLPVVLFERFVCDWEAGANSQSQIVIAGPP